MKIKVYPIKNMNKEVQALYAPFAQQLEVICASLAHGTSTIKNVANSVDIQTTINWCENIGAKITKNGNTLTIVGNNNKIEFVKSPLFINNESASTAKLMIPLLCTIKQPFGIKANEKILTEISQYKNIFEKYGINFYIEESMIRFENVLKAEEVELDGDTDIKLIAGLFMALPLLSQSSAIRLIAPITSEANYKTITKILKTFSIDVKHPATMKYTFNGGQKYHAGEISTEIDLYNLSLLSVLSLNLKSKDSYLKIPNYQTKTTMDDRRLFDLMKTNICEFNPRSKKMKRRDVEFRKLECNVENSLPLLMVSATLNSMDTVITRVDTSKERVEKQLGIMSRVFDKLGLEYSFIDDNIIIHQCKVLRKYQVSCEGDPHIAMALSVLACVSKHPIVIKDIDCVFTVQKDFFNQLESLGTKIEYIHN